MPIIKTRQTPQQKMIDVLQEQLADALHKADKNGLEAAAYKQLYERERARHLEYKEKVEIELAQARRLRSVIQDALSTPKTALE